MQEKERGMRSYPTAIGLAVIHLGALGVFVPALFSWSGVAVAVALYVVTGFGITLGYHRLLTHRNWRCRFARISRGHRRVLAVQEGGDPSTHRPPPPPRQHHTVTTMSPSIHVLG